MRRRAKRLHLAWNAKALCEQRFPKPALTKSPREVTCGSCLSVANHASRLDDEAFQVWRAARGPAIPVEPALLSPHDKVAT